MVLHEMFAKLSSIISCAKAHDSTVSDEPFGSVNVILVGNFHQFLPIAATLSAPLYWPCNPEKDTDKDMLGRKLYEQFEEVVQLNASTSDGRAMVRPVTAHPTWGLHRRATIYAS